jgi:hypothetical protein
LVSRRRPTATAHAASDDSLRIIYGADRLRGWQPGDGWEKLFCGDCGSAMAR